MREFFPGKLEGLLGRGHVGRGQTGGSLREGWAVTFKIFFSADGLMLDGPQDEHSIRYIIRDFDLWRKVPPVCYLCEKRRHPD